MLGVILSAVYMLWMYQRVMFGEVTHEENRRLVDLNIREIAVLVPLLLAIIWIGVYPQPFLERLEASTRVIVERMNATTRAQSAPTEAAHCQESDRRRLIAMNRIPSRVESAPMSCAGPSGVARETEG
jgi:NADH-quinone oxidoreductase subunit M